MRIAIVCAGHVGGNLARLWSRAGHDVLIASRAGPWGAIDEALPQAGWLAGEIVIDATRPFSHAGTPAARPDRRPVQLGPDAGSTRRSSVQYADRGFQAEASGRPISERAVMFLCGDYAAAKRVAGWLVDDMGFVAFDLGSVAEVALMEAPRWAGAVYGAEFSLERAQMFVASKGSSR